MKSSTHKWILGLAGLGLLAAAVYLGVHFSAAASAGGISLVGRLAPGDGGQQSVVLGSRPAAEVPPRGAEVVGSLAGIDGNRLSVALLANTGAGSALSGQEKEVALTRETRIFRDVTLQTYQKTGMASDQQLLEPAGADDLRTGDVLAAWGSTRGDRTTADVLVFIPGANLTGADLDAE